MRSVNLLIIINYTSANGDRSKACGKIIICETLASNITDGDMHYIKTDQSILERVVSVFFSYFRDVNKLINEFLAWLIPWYSRKIKQINNFLSDQKLTHFRGNGAFCSTAHPHRKIQVDWLVSCFLWQDYLLFLNKLLQAQARSFEKELQVSRNICSSIRCSQA